ncbi:hypothetical protein COCON_G00222130 [Conger conger]|uniref:SERTA domain-containing protein n=1 Tax=Conger conger TaxID=82655 RepID=A0A9Q1HNG4_CONCO|nr:hypothetical protein COCON_G00222130 [Conger conger]
MTNTPECPEWRGGSCAEERGLGGVFRVPTAGLCPDVVRHGNRRRGDWPGRLHFLEERARPGLKARSHSLSVGIRLGNAAALPQFMLGKGVKRKLDEDEDGVEGKALAPGGPADGPSKVSYTLQRQTIFNISLMKLYSQRAAPEPSLARAC